MHTHTERETGRNGHTHTGSDLFLILFLYSFTSFHFSSLSTFSPCDPPIDPPPLPQHLLPIPSVWPFDQNHTDKHLCSKSNIHILIIKLKLDSNCTLFPSTEQNLVLELECNVLTWFNGLHLYMSLFNVDVKLGTLLRVRDGLLELVTLNYTETMHYIVVLFVQTLKRFKCLHFKSSSNYMATYIVQKVIILQNG